MKPKAENIGRLHGLADVAALFQVSPKTVQRLVTRGELACVRVGHQLRFREQDIELFLSSSRNGRGVR